VRNFRKLSSWSAVESARRLISGQESQEFPKCLRNDHKPNCAEGLSSTMTTRPRERSAHLNLRRCENKPNEPGMCHMLCSFGLFLYHNCNSFATSQPRCLPRKSKSRTFPSTKVIHPRVPSTVGQIAEDIFGLYPFKPRVTPFCAFSVWLCRHPFNKKRWLPWSSMRRLD
jgi:hypothetical protein